jgi:hypothetical protein
MLTRSSRRSRGGAGRGILQALLSALAVLAGVAILVVGTRLLPAGLAIGLFLPLSLAALTYVFYTDIKRSR